MSDQQWIPRSERAPTKADGDKIHGRIWVQMKSGQRLQTVWDGTYAKRCIAFMPIRTPEPYVPPEPVKPVTIEQACRDLLEIAIRDRLVREVGLGQWHNTDPQARSSGELVGMANCLSDFIYRRKPPAKVVTRADVDRVIHLTKHMSWDRTIDDLCELFGVEA